MYVDSGAQTLSPQFDVLKRDGHSTRCAHCARLIRYVLKRGILTSLHYAGGEYVSVGIDRECVLLCVQVDFQVAKF